MLGQNQDLHIKHYLLFFHF